jgi:preprotein translocase subunit SecB
MTEKAEKETPQNSEQPVFRLQKLFVKDLSFENPGAPEVFVIKQGEPKVEVNLGLKNKKMAEENLYEVSLSITAKITHGADSKTLFIIEVEHGGIFTLKNIPEQHLPAVLAVDCPAMMFPYTRQIISQLSVDGGFVPFLMEPVNFLALYQNAQKKAGTTPQEPTQ